mgnify:CR=1 FL=1
MNLKRFWNDFQNGSASELFITVNALVQETSARNRAPKEPLKQSFKNIQTIIDEIKNVNGHFISVWHNETWSDYKEWSGWSYLYEQMLEYINK